MNDSDVFRQLFAMVENYYIQRKQGKFLDYKEPEELKTLLDLQHQPEPGNWKALFQWMEKYLEHSVKTDHPDFLNRMWSGANLPSIAGEIIAAVSNTSACTYETAPVSTLMEHYMLDTMLKLVGFTEGEGQMTTGSSNGNMIAMLAARNQAAASCKEKGLFQQPPLTAFVSEDAHYSLDKAANILGLGTDNLIKIPVDQQGRMRIDALDQALLHAHQQGCMPFFVCATLGTTVRGAYDPILPLLKLRQTHGFWLHGDGAWGGAALFDDDLRLRYLPGVEKLDSFTWDFHKMPGSNLMCNMLLLNQGRGTLRCACSSGEHSYLFREEDPSAELDTGIASLQCGRKVDALKWFLDWKFYGKEGFALRVRHYLQLAEQAEHLIENTPCLELTAPRESFNICFRYLPPDGHAANEFNLALRTRLLKQGSCSVGIAYINEVLTLRLLITHPDFSTRQLEEFFARLIDTAQAMSNG